MQDQFGKIFGAIIAYILLLLYAGSVFYMIAELMDCAGDSSCEEKAFTEGMIHVVTIIGGLVSALVVSKLTITTPGDNPALIESSTNQSDRMRKASIYLAIAYLAVWVFTGLAALVVGVMLHPGINSTVSDIGTTWLGLAVASGYAYFGLNPAK